MKTSNSYSRRRKAVRINKMVHDLYEAAKCLVALASFLASAYTVIIGTFTDDNFTLAFGIVCMVVTGCWIANIVKLPEEQVSK